MIIIAKKKNEKPKHQKLLNEKDPIDKHILRLMKKNDLKVGIIDLGKYVKSKKKKWETGETIIYPNCGNKGIVTFEESHKPKEWEETF